MKTLKERAEKAKAELTLLHAYDCDQCSKTDEEWDAHDSLPETVKLIADLMARNAELEAANKWKPIAKMPEELKDGRYIWIKHKKFQPVSAGWDKIDQVFKTQDLTWYGKDTITHYMEIPEVGDEHDQTFCASPHCKNECGRQFPKDVTLPDRVVKMRRAYFCGEPKLDIFDECVKINKIEDNALAIEKLLELVKYCEENNIEQIEIMNHLLRNKELYSYMKGKMTWQDEFARNLFCGEPEQEKNDATSI